MLPSTPCRVAQIPVYSMQRIHFMTLLFHMPSYIVHTHTHEYHVHQFAFCSYARDVLTQFFLRSLAGSFAPLLYSLDKIGFFLCFSCSTGFICAARARIVHWAKQEKGNNGMGWSRKGVKSEIMAALNEIHMAFGRWENRKRKRCSYDACSWYIFSPSVCCFSY